MTKIHMRMIGKRKAVRLYAKDEKRNREFAEAQISKRLREKLGGSDTLITYGLNPNITSEILKHLGSESLCHFIYNI